MVQIVVNLHNGGSTVGGNANDVDPLTSTKIDLNDFDDGSDSLWDMTLTGATLTSSSSGRNAQLGGDPSYYSDINQEGNFRQVNANSIDVTFSNIPSNVTSFDIHVALCTTFSGQTDLRIVCEAESLGGIDSTTNTTGQFWDLIGIVPDGSNEALLQLFNDSSAFVFWNGFHIDNIQTTGGPVYRGPKFRYLRTLLTR